MSMQGETLPSESLDSLWTDSSKRYWVWWNRSDLSRSMKSARDYYFVSFSTSRAHCESFTVSLCPNVHLLIVVFFQYSTDSDADEMMYWLLFSISTIFFIVCIISCRRCLLKEADESVDISGTMDPDAPPCGQPRSGLGKHIFQPINSLLNDNTHHE